VHKRRTPDDKGPGFVIFSLIPLVVTFTEIKHFIDLGHNEPIATSAAHEEIMALVSFQPIIAPAAEEVIFTVASVEEIHATSAVEAISAPAAS
jgi:hypothetical protein